MTRALIVNSAATGEGSVSTRLTNELVEQLKQRDPSLEVTVRDIGRAPIPHLTADTVAAIKGVADSLAERNTLALSNVLVEELVEADLLVIGAPMYNFGIASTLKSWFDHVLRSGVTFRYTENGPEGLVKGKRAVVIETRGGLYTEGPGAALDAQEPHLRALLGFIGITDVTFVRAEKLAFGLDAASAAIAAAVEEIGALAEGELALAA